MPSSQDLAIFVPTTDKTNCFTPCVCVRGKYVLKPHKVYLISRPIEFQGGG